jgi:hypothetical protein
MQPSSIPGLISPLNWLVQIFSQIWLGRKVFLIKKIKMKAETNVTTKPSTPEIVDVFMSKLKYPLFDVAEYLRKFILSVDKEMGEEILWNAPAFFYTGKMKPFKPKEYKRYIVGFNLFRKDCVRLIFLRGASVSDPTGLLEGEYKDGRRLLSFKNMTEVKSKEKELKKIIKQLVKLIKKQ